MSTWKYNRMYARQAATPVGKVVEPSIPARLDKMLATSTINDWERAFCLSIKAGYEKYNSLTVGQNDTFIKIEARNDPAAQTAQEAWKNNFTPEMMASWTMMIEYYSKTQYYTGAVRKWQADKEYVPNEKEYESICNNIYAKRMLAQVVLPPKFKVGDLVVLHQYGMYVFARHCVRGWQRCCTCEGKQGV